MRFVSCGFDVVDFKVTEELKTQIYLASFSVYIIFVDETSKGNKFARCRTLLKR